MIKETSLTRVEYPVCGHRLMDKGDKANGPVQTKCTRCKRIWQVDLATDEFQQVSGKPITRRKGDYKSP